MANFKFMEWRACIWRVLWKWEGIRFFSTSSFSFALVFVSCACAPYRPSFHERYYSLILCFIDTMPFDPLILAKKKTVRTKNRMVIYELAQFERNSYNSFTNRGRKKSKLLTAFTAAELLEWKIIRFCLQFQWDCIIDIAFVVCIRPTAWWLYCGIRVLENISIVYISILMVLFMACEATLARYNSVRM